MLAKYGRGSILFHLQYPIKLKWYECKRSFDFLTHSDIPLFLFDSVAIATNGKPGLLIFTFFPSSATILLIVWSANGDGSTSTKASFKVKLLNDDTYQLDSVTIIVSSFRQIEQGAH